MTRILVLLFTATFIINARAEVDAKASDAEPFRPSTEQKFCPDIAKKDGTLGPVGNALVKIMGDRKYVHYFTNTAPPVACPKFGTLKDSEKLKTWAVFMSALSYAELLRQRQVCSPTATGNEGKLFGYWMVEKSPAVRAKNNRAEECAHAVVDGTPEGIKGQELCALSMMQSGAYRYWATLE